MEDGSIGSGRQVPEPTDYGSLQAAVFLDKERSHAPGSQELEALPTQIQPDPSTFYERWEVLLCTDRGIRRTGAMRTGDASMAGQGMARERWLGVCCR